MGFESLLEEIRQCEICQSVLPHAPRPVLQFHPEAKILIAGQAPGRKVHETGVPFNDASGDRLRQWMGISKATFYDARQIAILPMGFCYPGTGKNGDLPPRPECAAAWREALLAQLTQLELTLVIGQYAQAYHLASATSVTDMVKDWQTFWPDKVPLPHPSPRNNAWFKRNPWFEQTLVPSLQKRISQVLGDCVSTR